MPALRVQIPQVLSVIREKEKTPEDAERVAARREVGPEWSAVSTAVFYLGDLYAESGQTLQGSFSAVSKPNCVSEY